MAEDTVIYAYVATDGSYHADVPARDLTREAFDALPDDLKAVVSASPIYAPSEGEKRRQRAEARAADEPAPAKHAPAHAPASAHARPAAKPDGAAE